MFIPWDELEASLSSPKMILPPNPLSLITTQIMNVWKQWASARLQRGLRTFQPKVRLFIDRDDYVIKTVESSWELEECLRLRHEVFYQELLKSPEADGLDADPFDLRCDHLAIVNKSTRRIIGTYRLISSTFSDRFYSATEFDIAALLALPGAKLELGRACIQKDHRNGYIVALLWRGIYQYAQAVGARYLFGCSSVPTTDPYAITQVRAYLRTHGYTLRELDIPARPGYRMPHLSDFSARYENEDPVVLELARRTMPPLLLSYLKSGAKVGAEPALDKAFRCVDFMTVLETDRLSAAHGKKFAKC